MTTRVTIDSLHAKKKSKAKIAALTAYDFVTAKIMDEVGVDLILVGDSLGMVILGYENTLKVSMSEMIHHTKAVSRAVRQALVVADMPFLSYGVSDEWTLQNAGRFIQEAGAQAVKLEGGQAMARVVRKIVDLGIPVLGHIGMTPTHVLTEGGYHVQGKNEADRQRLMEDALSLQDAGAFGIVLECVKANTACEISEKLTIPTIGIGSGANCDGQILVSHDLLGLYEEIKPKYVKRYAELASQMKNAFKSYQGEVANGTFPGKEHSF